MGTLEVSGHPPAKEEEEEEEDDDDDEDDDEEEVSQWSIPVNPTGASHFLFPTLTSTQCQQFGFQEETTEHTVASL